MLALPPLALRLLVALLLLALLSSSSALAPAVPPPAPPQAPAHLSVPALLQFHGPRIAALKSSSALAQLSDMTLLRHVMKHGAEAEQALQETQAWRAGAGKHIVAAAARAVEQAMQDPKRWDNRPVEEAAPSADKINPRVADGIVTTTATNGVSKRPPQTTTSDRRHHKAARSPPPPQDLVYCIRAAAIEDKELMKSVTQKQLVDYFL